MRRTIAVWPDGTRVEWRGLTWAEFKFFKDRLTTDPIGIPLEIYKTVVIRGSGIEEIPAGVAAFVVENVTATNPFLGTYKEVKKSLDISRMNVGASYLQSARALVSHVFRYSFEDIDKWDAETFFNRVAQAEFITGRPLEPAKPNDADRPKTNLYQQEVSQVETQEPPRSTKKEKTDIQKKALDRARIARQSRPA